MPGTGRLAPRGARAGVDPTFLLCNTYRLGGYHIGDKQGYKDVGEAFTWRAKDPIVQLRI
jgi:TPP-dependent pyruvate/acetoin dehydrogenase alpha subunit